MTTANEQRDYIAEHQRLLTKQDNEVIVREVFLNPTNNVDGALAKHLKASAKGALVNLDDLDDHIIDAYYSHVKLVMDRFE